MELVKGVRGYHMTAMALAGLGAFAISYLLTTRDDIRLLATVVTMVAFAGLFVSSPHLGLQAAMIWLPLSGLFRRLLGIFLGHVNDRRVGSLMASCRALIFPGEEDFGITGVEANAAGRPVIAYRGGGALDTVNPEVTGVFFSEPSADSLAEAVVRSARISWDRRVIRRHASQFDVATFRDRMEHLLLPLVHASRVPMPSRAAAAR